MSRRSSSVAVAARDDHARQRQALLGRDDMFDPLARVEHVENLDAEIARVLGKIFNLPCGAGIRHRASAHRRCRIDVSTTISAAEGFQTGRPGRST